ncbi:hypothetical protein M3Y98_00355100 [Aphelenchoides besseyi]|nr:hypothetical protein M3Y98_00355100 [Aphelenchoides besseyi]
MSYNEDDYEEYKNKTVVLVVPEILPPFVNYVNASYEYENQIGYGPGICWQILRMLAEHFNLTYNVETVDMNSDERWDEAFKKLGTTAEIIVGATVMEHHIQANTTFTFPFQFEETGLLYQMSTRHFFQQQKISFTPFPYQVVLDISNLTYDYIRYAVNFKGTLSAERLLIMTWYQASFIFFVIYMVKSLFFPYYEQEIVPFKNFKSVVDAFESSHQYKLVLNRNSGRTEMLRKSVLPNIQRLWRKANENSAIIYAETIEDGIELVKENPNYFFLSALDTLQVVSNRDCRLRVVPEGILPAFMGLAVASDSKYIRPLDKIILRLNEFGFIKKWSRAYSMYMSQSYNGSCSEFGNDHFFELTFSTLRGPFILLASGLSIGLVFFLCELLRGAYVKSEIGMKFQQFVGLKVSISITFTKMRSGSWIVVVCLLLMTISFASAMRKQSVAVKGRLHCGARPAAAVRVNWMLVTQKKTALFFLSGDEKELSTIDPQLKIYHSCASVHPCPRRWTITIPELYITPGATPKKTFDIGDLNLEVELEGVGVQNGYAWRRQSVAATGKLTCGGVPAENVLVKLFDQDDGPDPDDLLGQVRTDSDGSFSLHGDTLELTPIDPELRIYHECALHIPLCKREWVIQIPNKYISSGATPETVFDLGVVNLEVELEDESRDCLH